MNLKPKRDCIFVRPETQTHAGSIALPESAKPDPYIAGEVVEVGGDVDRHPDHYAGLKRGDRVLFARFSSIEGADVGKASAWSELDGLWIVHASAVVGVLEGSAVIGGSRMVGT